MIADLKLALRQLAKTPGFAAVAIGTLALCIGANSAIFSVVHAILLQPYPWPESDRLVYVYNSYPRMGLANAGRTSAASPIPPSSTSRASISRATRGPNASPASRPRPRSFPRWGPRRPSAVASPRRTLALGRPPRCS